MSALFRVDPYSPYAKDLVEVRRRLSPQQQLFVDEYLTDMDAERAASSVGLPPNKGRSVLRQFYVAKAIDLCMSARRERLHVTSDKVVEELAKLSFANMADYVGETSDGDPYFRLSGLDRDQRAAISEVTIEDYVDGRGENARQVKKMRLKLYDKKAALDSLGRHLGMFFDRVEMRGQMDLKLAQLTREERLQYMESLLYPMQKYLTKEQREASASSGTASGTIDGEAKEVSPQEES